MVYENTHLWAAEKIRGRIKNKKIEDIIAANIDHYHLGAFFPDILFFNQDPKIRDSASFLHGAKGVPTNVFIFEILDHIRGSRDEKNLAFICGVLTHFAMDIVFHPLVFYFSGYNPQNGPGEQRQSAYLHWHYETLIDRHFNQKVFLERVVNPAVVDDVAMPLIQNISRSTLKSSLQRQIFYFRRIHSRFYYLIFKLLAGIGLLDQQLVGGFYPNLNVEKKRLPEKLIYRDIISGEDREATLDGLLEKAISLAVKMIASAYEYYAGSISKEICKNTIAGENLDTGRVDKTKEDIRFSVRS